MLHGELFENYRDSPVVNRNNIRVNINLTKPFERLRKEIERFHGKQTG